MSNVDNDNRADWALAGLEAFVAKTRMQQEDRETQFSDFLADLMHLASREKLVWEDLLSHGERHYEGELQEALECCRVCDDWLYLDDGCMDGRDCIDRLCITCLREAWQLKK